MRKNMKKCAKRSKNHAQKSQTKITNKKITKITRAGTREPEQKLQTKNYKQNHSQKSRGLGPENQNKYYKQILQIKITSKKLIFLF